MIFWIWMSQGVVRLGGGEQRGQIADEALETRRARRGEGCGFVVAVFVAGEKSISTCGVGSVWNVWRVVD